MGIVNYLSAPKSASAIIPKSRPVRISKLKSRVKNMFKTNRVKNRD